MTSAVHHAEALTEAGQALAEGGQAWTAGDVPRAAAAFGRAALLAPTMAQAHGNLGVALRRLGRLDAALTSYGRALALTPDDPALHSNMGNALREMGMLEQAEAHLARAHAARPDEASFTYNLALVIRDRRRHAEARQMMADLARAHPGNADYAWDLALTDLYLTDYARGFAGYEARWGLARTPPRDLPGERWRFGAAIAGKTVLIAAEQGFGDALQFARFLPVLARQGAKVIVECQPELMALFAAIPGITQVVEKHGALPAYDLWAPMMSLAWLLGVTWQTLPQTLPTPPAYLTAPQPLAQPLGRPPGTVLNVGLIWAGKTTPRDRSWPLEKLLPLMEDPRAAFWSLQMGDRAGDLARLGMNTMMRDLAPRLHSFAHTAGAMAELDLIITIDTSAAHLAAALGRPTWILLRTVSDWRWLDEPAHCAWYPTATLFRQPDPADFTTPVEQVRQALTQMLDKRQLPNSGAL
ncbi:MAG: tetratricopeptide repeat protein [Rhodospirillaceae bacterium]|nr:tetratricopeptide repeat protein [Rhodospirillales bacterium]